MIWNYLNSPPRKQGTTDREKIRMEKKMFSKKSIIIIALAIIVLGSLALHAVEYTICVHMNSSGPTEGYYQIPTGSGNTTKNLNSGLNTFDVNGPYPANFYIYQALKSNSSITGAASIGVLDPDNVNHIYMNVGGSEPIPPPEEED